MCGLDRKDQHKLQQLTIFGLHKQVWRVNGFLFQCTPVIIFALQCNSVSTNNTLFLIYDDIYDLFVILEERLTITLHIVLSNLNYPDLDYPDWSPWSRSFFFFSVNINKM